MSHLTLEDIARLVDEPPDRQEAEHLAACAACRAEFEDMRADSAVLASLPPIDPPASEWAAIEARLAREGLIRAGRLHAASFRGGLLRMAAAIAIFFTGTLTGVAWVGSGNTESASNEPLGLEPLEAPVAARTRDQGRNAVAPGNVQLATSLISAREPRSPEEAAILVREIEALYFQALTRFTEAASAAESADPLTRLAVLEGITTLTGAALGQAPADPVLNGYHLAALAQREATLKLIAARTNDTWF